ncbi:MAG: hypothetical protein JWP04_1661 [Belnapia sp.]|nr:hypothetical protein [Belnapia sp.]
MASSIGSTFSDASGNGYRVVLADDFSNGYQASKWGYAFNGGTYWNGAFTWSSSDVNVRAGEMQVTETRQANGSWTSGGFNSFKAGNTITYGTVEFDARVETAQGTHAAILMWPKSDAWPRDGEIDILEAPKGVAMHSSHWAGTDGSHQYSSIFSTFDPNQMHHYTMIWLPTKLTIKIDGTTVAEWTDPAAIPDTAMGFGAMGYVGAKGETWVGGAPNASTPQVVTTHIDNVVMSQWTGVTSPPPPPPPPKPAGVDTTPLARTIGTGTDTLVLKISQDVWQTAALYTISVDGKQIGGTLSAGAAAASGQDDIITVHGDWAAGAHKVTVNFTNDGWGGTAATDRNLHVDGITYNGTAIAGTTAKLAVNGPVSFGFTEAAVPVIPAAPATFAALFGDPGTWGKAAAVATTTADFDGTHYTTLTATPAWGGVGTIQAAPATWDAAWSTHVAVDNFPIANLDLRAAGSRALDVLVLDAKGGTITLGAGDDHLTWVAHGSPSGGTASTMLIHTGGGDNTIHLTSTGLSALDHRAETGTGDTGAGAVAQIRLGDGHDTVTTEGAVRLVLNGGSGFATASGGSANDSFYAGSGGGSFTGGGGRDMFIFGRDDGHVTITDFASGFDKLKFMGLNRGDLHVEAATEGGIGGLLVTYDAAGDSVFLAGAGNVAANDMLFG